MIAAVVVWDHYYFALQMMTKMMSPLHRDDSEMSVIAPLLQLP
jgi:hypothetical protein